MENKSWTEYYTDVFVARRVSFEVWERNSVVETLTPRFKTCLYVLLLDFDLYLCFKRRSKSASKWHSKIDQSRIAKHSITDPYLNQLLFFYCHQILKRSSWSKPQNKNRTKKTNNWCYKTSKGSEISSRNEFIGGTTAIIIVARKEKWLLVRFVGRFEKYGFHCTHQNKFHLI